MPRTEVILYIDYKSPYAYVATAGAYKLQEDYDIALRWLPYTLDIPHYLGDVENRTAHQWRRVRYSYMDARRFANQQGLILRGPQKIFDTRLAHIGMLYAHRQDVFRRYNDITFDRFWKRELDLESFDAVEGVLREAGADTAAFSGFVEGEGGAEHDRLRAEAEAAGVFGVPMFVVDGELFWGGDRLPQVREKLDSLGLARRK